MARLLLFDIDCTLVDTGGAGMASLKEAAAQQFGGEGPSLDLAGSTDSGIVKSILDHFQMDHSEQVIEEFYQRYLTLLKQYLLTDVYGGRLLDGVLPLLNDLRERQDVFLGLLTGNIARGADIKVRHFGVSEYFGFGSYGDDHWDRNKLGPIALQRAEAFFGRAFTPEETVVIGDTPKDIACGKAIEAKTVCVATGKFSVSELEAYQPDVVLTDLQNRSASLAAIL